MTLKLGQIAYDSIGICVISYVMLSLIKIGHVFKFSIMLGKWKQLSSFDFEFSLS